MHQVIDDSNQFLNITNCSKEVLRQLVAEAMNSTDAGDATWVLTSAFIIFTMQSGFGLLEAGSCSVKNECNIMVKNAVDVVFGAISYWMIGYGLSFGHSEYTNGFNGVGSFFTESTEGDMGHIYSKFFFQLSFATTATTIVSGAMAERTNLKAYMAFSTLNMFSYVFPAHWIWDEYGFLKKLGAFDMAGCGPVHIVGGASALIATIMLKPRHGRFTDEFNQDSESFASPTNIVLGTFMLWWGWLGFNCGSTFGVSGGKWKVASKAAVVTINGSAGGGVSGVIYCYVLSKKYNGKLDVQVFTSCILAGMVSITGICGICRTWEALVIGFIGGIICCYGTELLNFIHIDDPVSCIPVHGLCGLWGMIAIGLFAEVDRFTDLNNHYGLFKGGGVKLLGLQLLACLCFFAWSSVTTIIELFIVDKLFGLRVSLKEELEGADSSEHGIIQSLSVLGSPKNEEKVTSRRKISAVYGHKKHLPTKKHSNSPTHLTEIKLDTLDKIKDGEEDVDEKKQFYANKFIDIFNKSKQQAIDNIGDIQRPAGKQYTNTGLVNFGCITITDGTVTEHIGHPIMNQATQCSSMVND